MMRRLILVTALCAMAASTTAMAGASDKPVSWQFDFGYTMMEGDASKFIDNGYTLGFGAVLRPNPKKAINWRFDFTYDWADVNTGNLPTGDIRIDDGDWNQWSLRAGIQFETHGDKAHMTFGAGIGGYKEYARVEQTILVPGYICDPWYWWYCYPGLVQGDVTVGSKSLTKFGYYGSLGVVFPLQNSDFFIEAQYHWVDLGSADFTTLPIVLGWRW